MNHLHRIFAVVLLLATLSGCGNLPGGQRWGDQVRLQPGWDRIGKAAADAAVDPLTWAPLAGAVIFRAGDLDDSLSEWASDNTPVFGSKKSADRAGDYLLGASLVTYGITVLAAPGGDDPGEWMRAKLQRSAVGGAAALGWLGSVSLLKEVVGRTRPDGSDTDGFPSGHVSGATLFSTLSSRNLEALPLSDVQRRAMNVGLAALTTATAWSRIEAEEHFASDVLAGVALGHFLGAFFNHAFLAHDSMAEIRPEIDLAGKTAMFHFTLNY